MALGPYVTALVETIARGNQRAEPPAAVSARLAGPASAPDLRAILEAWAQHEGVVRIGDLVLDPDCLDRPVPGTDGSDRDDLVRLGEFDSGDLVAVKWPPTAETDVWWIERENGWQAEDYGGLEAFLEYRVSSARKTSGSTDLDAALGWTLVKASLGPYVTSLLETIERGKPRPEPFAALSERIAGQALPPDLRGLLEAWVQHGGSVSLGDLTLYPDCVKQPVPDSEGDDRDDLLSLGSVECGDMVAVKWPPGAMTELFLAVHDCGWDLEPLGSLEMYLERRVDKARDKGETTDLDKALASRGK